MNYILQQWKTDIFGNQYALYKCLSSDMSIYDKRNMVGSIWVRNQRNLIQTGDNILSNIYTKINERVVEDVSNQLLSGIRDFDIFYDLLHIRTTDYAFFAKIYFDWDTNTFDTTLNDIYVTKLGECAFWCGTWFFDKEKTVTYSILITSDTGTGIYTYPILYSIDLNENKIDTIYNGHDTSLYELSAIGLTSIEDPVFTYTNLSNKYNIAFLGYSNSAYGMYFTSIDITPYNNTLTYKCIIPRT